MPGQLLEPRFVEQHASREDISLDEIGAARITVKQAMIDADELQRRAAP
jgi:hypothetical protein